MTWFSTPPHCTLPKKNVQLNMESQGMVRMSPQSMTHPVLARHIPVRIKHVHFLPQREKLIAALSSTWDDTVPCPCSIQTNTWKKLNFVPTEATACEPDLSSGSRWICEPTILSTESQSTEANLWSPRNPTCGPRIRGWVRLEETTADHLVQSPSSSRVIPEYLAQDCI